MQTAFDCLLEAVPLGVLVLDAGRTIRAANPLAATLLARPGGGLLGRRLDELLGEPSRGELIEAGARLLGADATAPNGSSGPVVVSLGAGAPRALSLELRRVQHDGQAAMLATVRAEVQAEARAPAEREPVPGARVAAAALRRPADTLGLALEAAPTGMLVVSDAGSILIANEQLERLFGYSRGALIGQPLEVLVPPTQRERHVEHRAQFRAAPTPRPMAAGRDLYGLHRDGRELPVEIALMPLDTGDGPVVVASVVDISERKQAERALLESEARHRALFDDSPVPLLELDLTATRAALATLGEAERAALWEDPVSRSPEALCRVARSIGLVATNQSALGLFEASDPARLQAPATLFAPETAGWLRAALQALWAGQLHFGAETKMRTLSGGLRAVSMRIHLLPGHTETWSRAVVSLFDLTAHEQAEEQLRASLREKEVLLREVHHRVKNNLQIVSSLLNLKADGIENAAAQQVFADCQARIRSLAFVHEHLYVASDLSHVPFGQYMRTLASHLERSFRAPGQRVSIMVSVGDLNLSIDDAIPCGLIVNELVTNSLKHAFSPTGAGTIEIRMRRAHGHRLELSVSDDGRGLPSEVDPGTSGGSGLDLVHTFAEQLEAEVDIARQRGTRFTFRFAAAGARPPMR